MRNRRRKRQRASNQYRQGPHRCPVCRIYEFSHQNSYDVCPVCGWIDDAYQEEFPGEDALANTMSLNEAKRAYETLCSKSPRKAPLLTVFHYNWSLRKAGDWESTEWMIFRDGSYSKRTSYMMTIEEYELARQKIELCDFRKIYTESGEKLTPDFSELLDAINTDPWRPDGEVIHACDGDAWAFRQFDMTGKTVRDSGRPDYIYGNAVLERIASLLP